MPWSFYVPAFCPKNRKNNRKRISNQDVCLKCGHPIQVPHGRDSGLNPPPPSHMSQVYWQFTDGRSSLAESYSGFNNLPQKVAVKHLNSLAYKQSRPTNPERCTWWPPAFLNSFHWKQGWDRLLCHNPLEYQSWTHSQANITPNDKIVVLQHQTPLLKLRNLSIRSKAPVCLVLFRYRGQHLLREVKNHNR